MGFYMLLLDLENLQVTRLLIIFEPQTSDHERRTSNVERRTTSLELRTSG